MTLNNIFNTFVNTSFSEIGISYEPRWNSYSVRVNENLIFGIARFDYDDSTVLAYFDGNEIISWDTNRLSEDEAYMVEFIFNAVAA